MTKNSSDFNRAIWDEVDSVYEETVQIRRHIHKNPEISGCEQKTASFITSKLSAIGIQSKQYIDKTAVVGTIRNGKGPTIVLRADIDALPIQEVTGLPYSSINEGVMHACGHDLHTACLLGASKVLYKMRPHWSGTAVVLFQPQEEVEPGGAAALIECGAFPVDADAVFGLHVNAEHESGTVGLKKVSIMLGFLHLMLLLKVKVDMGGRPRMQLIPYSVPLILFCNFKLLSVVKNHHFFLLC